MRVIRFSEGGNSGSPDHDAWHRWRAGGIGSSDALVIAVAFGLIGRPDFAVEDLLTWMRRKVTGESRHAGWVARRGRALEPTVRRNYERAARKSFAPAFGEMEEEPRIRASFDGLSSDGDILEIKCPTARRFGDPREIHDHYYPQLAHLCLVHQGSPRRPWAGTVHFVRHQPDHGWTSTLLVPAESLRPLARELYARYMWLLELVRRFDIEGLRRLYAYMREHAAPRTRDLRGTSS